MKLIIGLGNPTLEYQNTRHNLGFICLERWASKHGKHWSHEQEFDYLCEKGCLLLKPSTWMNRSGEALKLAMERWQITDTMVIYDDLELETAILRIRKGGGDGGHNGMKSLFTVLPPKELKRIRIGIGRGDETEVYDHVLSEIPVSDWELYNPVLELAGKFIDTYIRYDFDQVLNEFSIWKKSYSAAKSSGIISPKEEI
ncbi:MAG: aminoacyl-tRNA hydrolase [Candidatus Cloacimonas sp.]|jgi:PTH1 family peptidyl-tRNA hydrolase|nr:aminoacyl-tRNA hydrolase [Candidatus Cloacimonas sp.]